MEFESIYKEEACGMRDYLTSSTALNEGMIEAVWQGGSASRFSKDVAAQACSDRTSQQQRWGWEIDHIKLVSKGGTEI
jgi:hypothetical protein